MPATRKGYDANLLAALVLSLKTTGCQSKAVPVEVEKGRWRTRQDPLGLVKTNTDV